MKRGQQPIKFIGKYFISYNVHLVRHVAYILMP
jgi:hypothetical protein